MWHGTCFIANAVKQPSGSTCQPSKRQRKVEDCEELSEHSHGGPDTILLVDDEEPVREFDNRMLKRFGYKVLTVSDGKNALELCWSEQKRIDPVILDLIMLEMGGRRCLGKLLEVKPEFNAPIASGYSEDGPVRKSVKTGAKNFIGKPYRVSEMLRAIRDTLDDG